MVSLKSLALGKSWSAGMVALIGLLLTSAMAFDPPAADAGSPSLYVITDSVLLGAEAQLDAGYPGGTHIVGFPGLNARSAAEVVERDAHLVGRTVLVGLGYNYPWWDQPQFDSDIDELMKALRRAGARRVVWATLRAANKDNSPPASHGQVDAVAWYFPLVNRQLEKALDRHRDLFLADWTSISDGPGLTFDAIHLNGPGRRLMAGLVLDRVQDARAQPAAGRLQRVKVRDDSGDAVGAVVAISVSEPRLESRVTVSGCRAGSTSIRLAPVRRGDATSQVVLTPLDDRGRLCLRADDPAHLEVSLLGLIGATDSAAFAPKRKVSDCALPANRTNQRYCSTIGVPNSLAAQVLFARTGNDRVRLGSCDQPIPISSQLNASAGELVMVDADDRGELCWSEEDVKVTPLLSSAGLRPLEPEPLLGGGSVAVKPGEAIRVAAERFQGEVPLLRIRIKGKTSGTLRVGRCGRPGRSAPVLRFDRRVTASTTVFGFGNSDMCVISSAEGRLSASLVGAAGDEVVRTVLPRLVYSTRQ